LEGKRIKDFVELEKLEEALDQRRGIPVDITSSLDHER
jgi:hypothetical protein